MSLIRLYVYPIKYLFLFGLVFPFIYFIPILKDNALTGHVDVYFSIAYANDLAQYWQHLLTGSPYTQWLFQTEGTPPGERAIGLVSILAILRYMGLNDVSCHYVLISLIVCINMLSIFLYGYHVKEVRSNITLLAMSIFFSINSYMVGHMDTVNFLFVPFLLFSMYSLQKINKPKTSLVHGFVTGFQIYFSAYLFSSIVAILFITTLQTIKRIKINFIFFLGLLISSTPFIAYQNYVTSPIAPILKVISFRVKNVATLFTPKISTLYTNPINPFDQNKNDNDSPNNEEIKLWLYFGNEKWILLILSIIFIRKKITLELIVLGLGLFITFGYAKLVDLINAHMAIDFLYTYRFPDRSYIIAILALTIISGKSVYEFSKESKLRNILLSAIFILLHVGQTGMYPFKKWKLIEPSPEISNFFKSKPGAVVLNLPSDLSGKIFRFSSANNLFNYNLEILYMNWKSTYNINTLNGVLGYITQSRFTLQQYIDDLNFSQTLNECEESIRKLVQRYKVQYIVLHKNIVSELHFISPIYKDRHSSTPCTRQIKTELSNEKVTIFSL